MTSTLTDVDSWCAFHESSCQQNVCTCPNGTPTIASGSGDTLCEADSATDCSACRAGYTLSASAGTGLQEFVKP